MHPLYAHCRTLHLKEAPALLHAPDTGLHQDDGLLLPHVQVPGIVHPDSSLQKQAQDGLKGIYTYGLHASEGHSFS
jgi:hypothetical protein